MQVSVIETFKPEPVPQAPSAGTCIRPEAGWTHAFVYALREGPEGPVRYVGQTYMPADRYRQHRRKHRINDMQMDILETVRLQGPPSDGLTPRPETLRAEAKWIGFALALGIDLLNHGGGVCPQ